jgi:hypothetical protein
MNNADKDGWYWLGVVAQVGLWVLIYLGFLVAWVAKIKVVPFRYLGF